MDSTKCLACGLVNLSDALVCKRCHAPLSHSFSPPVGEPEPQFQRYWPQEQATRTSYRWAVQALVVSVVLFFVTTFLVYVWSMITTAVAETSKGWSDFTPDQLQQIGRTVGVLCLIEFPIVWFLFYRGKDNR
jgi:uncharacterized BrkB/YihY/UPF0761 family membrane protein